MTPSSQKIEDRPISFVIHDMARGTAPESIALVIRPEDLSISYPSRVAVTQTIGGAWADNFGPGVPTINISGHTGWRGNDQKDGLALFEQLHSKVFKTWHSARAAALKDGLDPDLVKLIFSDMLDNVTWSVLPNQFVLKRNKARPLLAQYQISMTYLSDDVKATMAALENAPGLLSQLGLASLEQSLKKIQNFVKSIKGKIAEVLGPISNAVRAFVAVTSAVLKTVKSVIGLAGYAVGGLLSIARDLTKAGANIMATVAAVKNLPATVRGMFMEVRAAFHNAFCVMKNALKGKVQFPTYDSIYGASTCSSTSGGRPISAYIDKSPFPSMFPTEKQPVSISGESASSLKRLSQVDPVTTSNPSGLKADIEAVSRGVVVNV